MLARAAFEISF